MKIRVLYDDRQKNNKGWFVRDEQGLDTQLDTRRKDAHKAAIREARRMYRGAEVQYGKITDSQLQED